MKTYARYIGESTEDYNQRMAVYERRRKEKEEQIKRITIFHYIAWIVVALITVGFIATTCVSCSLSNENDKLRTELESIKESQTSAIPGTSESGTNTDPVTDGSTSRINITIPATEEPPATTEPEVEVPVARMLEMKYASVFNWQVYDYQDFGIEQMEYLYNKCNEYDISMEFVMSIYCTESSFRSTARNKNSSATGYGQIIAGTAEWVYENLLKRGEYDKENHTTIAQDWKLNIDLTTKLIDWLYGRYGTYDKTAQHYYGSTSEANNISYSNKVSANCQKLFNLTIDMLDA